MKIAGLIYGPEFHYLDHLAPLCALLNIPLIVTDASIAKQAMIYYPDLQLIEYHPHEAPDKITSEFGRIICSTPRILFEEVFFFAQRLQNKHIQTIWCPHGNSDKGRITPFMEALAEEKLLLVYGNRMKEFLKEKKVHGKTITIGNYRYKYWKKHKTFYSELLNPLPKNKKILLYAPTWQDAEKNSSFYPFLKVLLKPIPEKYHLLLKLHPNLYIQYPEAIKELKERKSENIEIIENFPPVYPILAKTDLYIGDMSSIGYDFLNFKRPMLLLLNAKKNYDWYGLIKVAKILIENQYEHFFEYIDQILQSGMNMSPFCKEVFGKSQLARLNKQLQSQ